MAVPHATCMPEATLDPENDVYINVCQSLRSIGLDVSFKSKTDLTTSFMCEN